MRCRNARKADCGEIREQLAVLGDRALRRSHPRYHVEHCESCRAFAAEVRRQKAGLAILLSVLPSLALKHRILTGAFAAADNDAADASGTAG